MTVFCWATQREREREIAFGVTAAVAIGRRALLVPVQMRRLTDGVDAANVLAKQ